MAVYRLFEFDLATSPAVFVVDCGRKMFNDYIYRPASLINMGPLDFFSQYRQVHASEPSPNTILCGNGTKYVPRLKRADVRWNVPWPTSNLFGLHFRPRPHLRSEINFAPIY